VNSTAKMSTRGKNGARGIICGLWESQGLGGIFLPHTFA
jgi:hypothetical protein